MKHKIDANYLQSIFIKYAEVESNSVEDTGKVPSSEGQIVLGKIIVEDCKKLGITDVEQDKNGYVVARVKGNTKAPTIAFIAHLDTYHGTNGKNVKPIVHKNYDGKSISLPKEGTVIKLEDFPELKEHVGKTIITASGDTLLGGDDKNGIAICMETAKFMMENKDFKHGDVCFAFAPDEEIGHGASLLDLKKLNAVGAYTLDSEGHSTITNETFCANFMTVTITGRDIHPGYAKDKMVNAIRAAATFVEKLPMDKRPETTEDRQGFLHPIKVDADVTGAKIGLLVRDFKVEGLKVLEDIAHGVADEVATKYKGVEIKFDIKEQYRNMRYELDKDPRIVSYAQEAMKNCGINPKFSQARGGTDGSQLSYRGLLTPDLPVGYYAFHSKCEWICLEEMIQAADIVKEIISVWTK